METVVEALQDVAQTDLKVFAHLAVLLVFTSVVLLLGSARCRWGDGVNSRCQRSHSQQLCTVRQYSALRFCAVLSGQVIEDAMPKSLDGPNPPFHLYSPSRPFPYK